MRVNATTSLSHMEVVCDMPGLTSCAGTALLTGLADALGLQVAGTVGKRAGRIVHGSGEDHRLVARQRQLKQTRAFLHSVGAVRDDDSSEVRHLMDLGDCCAQIRPCPRRDPRAVDVAEAQHRDVRRLLEAGRRGDQIGARDAGDRASRPRSYPPGDRAACGDDRDVRQSRVLAHDLRLGCGCRRAGIAACHHGHGRHRDQGGRRDQRRDHQ